MFFRTAERLEKNLEALSPNVVTVGSIAGAFAVAALAVTALPDEARTIVANVGGVTTGVLVILRQAGFKNADAMKKINIIKNSTACVQYGLTGNWTGVLNNINGLALNRLYLSVHGKNLPPQFSFGSKKIDTSFAIATGASIAVAALSAPFLMAAYNKGAESSALMGIYNASVQSLPVVANFLGIAAASQEKGSRHRLYMGGGGAISIGYDVLTHSYGMLLSSVGSFVSTAVGWYKHDRKAQQLKPS